LERDVEYYVTGGDARSDVFRATVLRRPAVIAFHWTIAYPPYLKLPPRSVTNDDAIVDAPVGSTVMLDLDASEPLTTAAIEVGGQAHPTIPGAQPNQRRASFAMRGSQPLIVRMMSEAGVPGEFTGGRVRATADLAPIVTLNPLESDGALLKLRYLATDDFGLSRLDAEVETEDGRQHVVPVALGGDEREQRGVLEIDAAAVNASKGDALIVRLRGEDRGGQFALSKPVRAIVGSARAAAKPLAPPPAALPATEPSQGVDVSGFSESLQAYFQAIAREHK
jgi:hypothetical protein